MVHVARLAGVALSTVSRVVNADPTVGAAIVSRVQAAIAESGYQVDATAQQLRRGYTGMLGAAIRSLTGTGGMVSEFQRAARESNLMLLSAATEDDAELEESVVRAMCRRIDGLLIEPIGAHHGYLQSEIDAGLPVVAVDRPAEGIDVDSVVSDNRGGIEVIHDVSFRAEAGQMVALVGSSGAGKSTIASLLARLYDVDSGAVRLAGADVRDVTFASLKDTVGVVTQDGHLFHESIRANLTLAAPDASDDQLWEALRRARLADVVSDMPDGLDTVVGERGYRLSGGQRQRLTIARLLLGKSRVVVLDEATASLDSESEAAVQQALAEALAGRTSLVIAHRLSTIRAADVILVVEDGRIVERGTHRQLLKRAGRYSELYETQFRDETTAA